MQLSYALVRRRRCGRTAGRLATSGVENTRAGDWRATRPSFRIEIGNDGWSWPTGAPVADAQAFAGKGLRGAALQKAIFERTSREIRFGTLTEQLPDPANRIVPDETKRDALGLPRPRIAYRLDDYTRAGLAEARRIHEAAFLRMQATEIHHNTDDKFQGAGHVIGTSRMGNDARTSVVNADLRSHDHPQSLHRRQRRLSDQRRRESDAHHRRARVARGGCDPRFVDRRRDAATIAALRARLRHVQLGAVAAGRRLRAPRARWRMSPRRSRARSSLRSRSRARCSTAAPRYASTSTARPVD